MILQPQIQHALPRPGEEAVRRQIAQAAQRLRLHRLARDRAQLDLLKSEPHLYQLVAGILKPQN